MISLRQQPRRSRESIVPMINVSFLLLVFFLLTAAIAPPPPIEVSPPEADGRTVSEGVSVYVSATGELLLEDGSVVSAEALGDKTLLHVSATLDATRLARAVSDLRAMGVEALDVIATERGG